MLSFEECNELSKNGEPCQMLTPDGKWVKFDESQVITKFRRAPRLFSNSGPRVLMYALHRLEEMVEGYFLNKGNYIDLPAVGYKTDWTVTGGSKGKLGGYVPRDYPTIEDQIAQARGHRLLAGVDMKDVRLRDIFRTYFRIVKVGEDYVVEMRNLEYAVNRWIEVFRVTKDYFKPNDNFNRTTDKSGNKWSWCIDCGSLMINYYVPQEWESNIKQYTDTFYIWEHCKRMVTKQRIPTVSRTNPSGTEVLYNIAFYVSNYLSIISQVDMHLKEFSDFIETNMEKSDDPTHHVYKPAGVPDNRSVVIYNQFKEFADYRDASLGKRKHDAKGILDHKQAKMILLRYFNNKYHGTIYEVREGRANIGLPGLS